MSKLNERLTLVANLSVVAGIVFLAVELQQNTAAIQAQTRHGITELQMEYSGLVATNRDLSEVITRGNVGMDELGATERRMFRMYVQGVLREYENSHYQYERGLFTPEEYEPRRRIWRAPFGSQGWRDYWARYRETYSPSFRAEIDRIVAEVEQAQ